MLCCLGLRERKGAELIACPTRGRLQVDLFELVQQVKRTLDQDVELPMKVAVMGCVVNGPGEAEGADVAVFAGDRRGIIYVQGEKVANVPEEEILDRLRAECLDFQEKVRRGEAKAWGEKKVDIVPPDPIGDLGSGIEKNPRGSRRKTNHRPDLMRRAFSLVELLVTLAVIGVLVALLLPALSSAQRSSKKRAESNAIRALHTAFEQYATRSQDACLPGHLDSAVVNRWNLENFWPGGAPHVAHRFGLLAKSTPAFLGQSIATPVAWLRGR